MRQGIDFSFSHPLPSAVKAAGYSFVIGYVSPTPAKNLTSGEVKAFVAAGVDVCLVWESTAGRALQGEAAGQADAHNAWEQAARLGIKNRPIYFAVDTDTSASAVAPYFKGVKTRLGRGRTGVYGSARVCRGLWLRRLVGVRWQTLAWSLGAWLTRVNLHQYDFGKTVGGAAVDIDRALTRDFGQFPAPSSRGAARRRKVRQRVKTLRARITRIRGRIARLLKRPR